MTCRTCSLSAPTSSSAVPALVVRRRVHVGVDARPLDVVREAHHRGLGHGVVGHQGALDLRRAQPVARDVQHVVHPAGDPVVAVLVAPAAVAGEVEARDTARSRSPGTAGGRRRSSAPARARCRAGRGCPTRRCPPAPCPCSSTSTGRTPKNGSVAEPGLQGVAPGSGVIRMPPVSVCHQVSTTAHRPSPTTSWYQIQTSGLIGSPTEPRMRSELRL